MKLILARPTYGTIDPKPSNHLLGAVMYAGNHGTEWLGVLSPDRVVHAAARNIVATEAVKTEADAVVWVDDDVVVPTQGIARLASYVERHENPLEFVSGMYFQRNPPHWPLVAQFDGENFRWTSMWPENVLAPVDGIGFGFCLTTTKLIRKIMDLDEVKESRDKGPFEYSRYSEDLTFCLRATKAGHRPHVDTGLLCGHLGDAQMMTLETFKRVAKERDAAAVLVSADGSSAKVRVDGEKPGLLL